MQLRLEVKQTKEVIDTTITNVKFYSFEKQFLSVTKQNGRKLFFRLNTVLSIIEEED